MVSRTSTRIVSDHVLFVLSSREVDSEALDGGRDSGYWVFWRDVGTSVAHFASL